MHSSKSFNYWLWNFRCVAITSPDGWGKGVRAQSAALPQRRYGVQRCALNSLRSLSQAQACSALKRRSRKLFPLIRLPCRRLMQHQQRRRIISTIVVVPSVVVSSTNIIQPPSARATVVIPSTFACTSNPALMSNWKRLAIAPSAIWPVSARPALCAPLQCPVTDQDGKTIGLKGGNRLDDGQIRQGRGR